MFFDVSAFIAALAVAFVGGMNMGNAFDKSIDLELIPQAQERCVDAAGLKSLTIEGDFVCNNGLRGELPTKE